MSPVFSVSVRSIILLSIAVWGARTSHAEDELRGRWTLVAAEFAGNPFDALNGSTMVLSKGQKTFTLPGGKIETGEYSLDLVQEPKQIDSTTKGRPGTEKGIYKIDGTTLVMCLSQSGTSRPTKFATTDGSDLVLLKFRRQQDRPETTRPKPTPSRPSTASVSPKGTRSFYMGFTGFVYDVTLPAVVSSRKFCRENGDMLAHHIEGVPWTAALRDEPFPKEFMREWQNKKLATPPGGKVYLAISPGRGQLKLADKGGPLPKELKGKSYRDPLVKKAYLNYCRRGIKFFEPDYLGIGIEVNEIFSSGRDKWAAYVDLHKFVYHELKKEHPDLPIFASFTLHNMYKKRADMLKEFQSLMPYNDLVAVSYYPFFVGSEERFAALDWMTENFDEFRKHYAMVETNDAAERLKFPKAGYVIEGTPQKQLDYYSKLLSLAQRRDFEFVVSFVHQDYDALWEKIKANSPELFIAWRDCGLLDQDGKQRPAYRLWRGYFELPLRQPQ